MKQKLRKISSLLLALLMLAATAAVFTPAISAATDTWNGTAVSNSLSGEGTKDSPYLVQSAADLAYIAKAASNEGDEDFVGKFFKQTVDIDLGGHHWTPIGDTKNAFKGSYNGDGHTVSGLNCDMIANSITDKDDPNYDADDKNYAGLFGRVSGDYDNAEYSTIENLTVRGTVVRALLCAGGVAAAAKNLVRIVNCHSEITQLDGSVCGGIVGRINFEGFSAEDKNYIVACTSKSGIFNDTNIPRNTKDNGAYDKDNISTGRSYTYVGGIAGVAQNVTIAYCTNSGLLDIIPLPNASYQSWVGGIAGVAGTSGAPQTTDIYFCTNNGIIKTYKSFDASSIVQSSGVVFDYTNTMRIGGIVGKLTNNNNNNTVAGCINTVMPVIYTSNSESANTVVSTTTQSFAGIAGFCNY